MDNLKLTAMAVAASVNMENHVDKMLRENPVATGLTYKGTKGHIFGWDNGKGPVKQRRNQPCSCGSGIKAKKCHVYLVPHGTPPLEEMQNVADIPTGSISAGHTLANCGGPGNTEAVPSED